MPPAPITGSPMKAAILSLLSRNSSSSSSVESWATVATSAIRLPYPSALAGMPARLVP